ncbi:hypothetical protein [Desulfoscipio gibsoniae]|uniref:hypothetical protein n=1 Tax=Desulfoscipio gibsoniae TaxID=102134 RepID=UPI000232BC97|nr:hypothetical protein [Desulfoscipio gibsoniae]
MPFLGILLEIFDLRVLTYYRRSFGTWGKEKESCTFECVKAGFAKRVSYLGWENGLILRPLIDDGLQISPSVVITEKQFDELVAKLGASIDQAYQEYCSK